MKNIDNRQLDLSIKEHKEYIDNDTAAKILESEKYMETCGIIDMYKKIALYCEGYQAPWGVSEDQMKSFVQKNYEMFDASKFQINKNRKGQLFFVDNRIGEIERGYVAEFTKVKKVSTVRQDKNPRNDGIEFAVKQWNSKLENRKRIWEQVRNPVIRYMLRYNLGFTRSTFNPFVNVKKVIEKGKGTPGDINMSYHHPATVLIDTTAIKKFMLESGHIIPFERMPLEKAKVYFESLGVDPETVLPDNNSSSARTIYDVPGGSDTTANKEYVTVYYPEYRKLYCESYSTNVFEYDEKGKLTPAQLKELKSYYFVGVYTKSLGMVKHEINKYADPDEHDQWQFLTVPYLYEQSDVSIYGPGPMGKLMIIQDVINICSSLKLSDAKQRALLRAAMKKTLYESLTKDVVDAWISDGGVLPVEVQDLDLDLSKVVHFLELPKEQIQKVDEILQMMDAAIKRLGIRKEVLQGQLPNSTAERMSGRLAREMKESNATLLQPIVQNIEWAVGTEQRLHYRMLAEEFGEDEWIEVLEAKKDDPKYLPIAKTTNLAGYIQYLAKAYPGLDPVSAHNKFKTRSDVKGEIRFKNPENGMLLDENDIMNGSNDIRINHLKDEDGSHYKFDFKVKMDFDIEDNELEEKVMITDMFKMNPRSLVWLELFLESQGGTLAARKDEIIERVKSENEAMQVMAVIEQLGPEGVQAFMAFAKEYMLRQQYNQSLQQNGVKAPQLAPSGAA